MQSEITNDYSRILEQKTSENIESGDFKSHESAKNAARCETNRVMNETYGHHVWTRSKYGSPTTKSRGKH